MSAIITTLDENARFSERQFTPVPLAQNDRVKAMIVCFEPGQFIPVHKPKADLVLTILDGSGTVVAGEREEEVGPGSIVFVPAGEARGVLAKTRLKAVTVVTPPPGEADHTQVRAGLQAGQWKP